MKNFLNKLLGVSDSTDTLTRPMNRSRASDLVRNYVTPQTTAEVIAEIHNAFNSAGDKLLAEAKAVLENTDTSSFEKADALRSIGFGNAKGVKEASATKQVIMEKAELHALLLQYAIKYPSYRFIDDASIEAICTKYNLIFGSASQYTGFVPAKNLAEIKAFAGVKPEDFVHQMRTTWEHDKEPGAWCNCTPSQGHYYSSSIYSREEYRSSKDHLICAPAKDMKLEKGQEVRGFQIVKVSIPDPVVLLPVKGNLYIILTAWGNESFDPLVVKEGLN